MDNHRIKEIKERERKHREAEMPFGEHVRASRSKYSNVIELKNVLKYLNLKKDDRLLDIGCSDGRFFEFLINARHKYRLTGIDFARNPLSKLKLKKITNSIVCGDISNLPFQSALFDKIASIQTLQQIPSCEARLQALKDIGYVLKNNGKMVITVLNQNTWYPEVKNGKSGRLGDSKYLHIYLYNDEDLKEELEKAGFNVIDIVGINTLPGGYVKKLTSIGITIDIFITKYFKNLSIQKGTYLLAQCIKK